MKLFIITLCCNFFYNHSAFASKVVSERVDFSRAMPEEHVEDMRVKVLGGYVVVDRFYHVMKRSTSDGYPGVSGDMQGYAGNSLLAEGENFARTEQARHDFGVWQFHRNWHDLIFLKGSKPSQSNDSPPKHIELNEYIYERVKGENYYVYEHNGNDLRITITEPGFRWSNRQDSWVEYNQQGQALRAGDKNNVTISFVRDQSGLITQYKDHNDNVVLTWEYQNKKPIKVTDYSGRSVSYKWEGDFLTEVTTVRGHKWNYEYQSFGANKVLVKKTDPENQTTTYEFAMSKGGFQAQGVSSNPNITILGDSPINTGQSNNNTSRYSVKVEPMLMHTAKVYSDGKRIRYQYLYDDESKSYMILQINSDGIEEETWYDLDGNVRFSLRSGKVVKNRLRNGKTAVSRDAYGNRTTTRYTRFEAVESITHADGSKVSYQYLPNYNFPVLKTDELGIQTKYEYDLQGNLTKTIEAANTDDVRIMEYEYDRYGQLKVQRTLGRDTTPTIEVKYDYDAYGNVIKVTDARGNVVEHKNYTADGQAQLKIDELGHQWQTTYDAFGNKLTTKTPLGFTQTNTYDSLNRLSSEKDAENRETRYEYDARNYKTKTIDNDGGVTVRRNRMDGQVLVTTDASGQTMSYQYDRVGRLVSVTDGVGNETKRVYEKQDEVVGTRIQSLITPNNITHYKYDVMGLIVEEVKMSTLDEADKRLTEYAYNAKSERTSIKDANGNITRYSYTPHGQLKTKTSSGGYVTTNEYDVRGNLISVTNALGKSYRYEYDVNNNQISETRPMGEQQTFEYDKRNSRVSFTDYNGNVAGYQYDSDGRVIEQSNTAAGVTAPQRVISYEYDKTNLQTRIADQHSITQLEYDAVKRQKQQRVTFTNNGAPFTKVLKTSYYKNGQIKTRTDAEGGVTSYAFDAAGRFKQMSIANAGSIVANAYQGNLAKSLTYPGGIARNHSYDGFASLKSITTQDNAGNDKLKLEYQYDVVGNIVEKQTLNGTFKYTYDDEYRLLSAEQPNNFGNQSYQYDAIGNRIEQQAGIGVLKYQYNDNHELTNIEKVVESGNLNFPLTYDSNGGQISGVVEADQQSYSYEYNAFGRLVKVKKADDSVVGEYEYDYSSRRLSKTVDGNTIYFLYDDTGFGLVGEYDPTGELVRGYVYGATALYSTNPVAQKIKSGEGYQYSFYQNDHLGTPQILISNNGEVQWQAEYDAFGNAQVISQTSWQNNHRFPGQYYDQETGLNQNWHRNYNPNLGRYISSDPIGLRGGINTFGYVGGNPLIEYDPKGLEKIKKPCCGALTDLLGLCPMIEKKDFVKECANDFVDDYCSKPCDEIVDSCKRRLAMSGYCKDTLCLSGCDILGDKCQKERPKCKPLACNFEGDPGVT